MEQTTTALDIGAMITGLGGGLALFLFGMRQMTEALKTVAGASMKELLKRLTSNRFTGAVAGALVTAVIQSSSVTTVLIVGFLTAGLLRFPQSIGVIIGANVGTTVTAQIVAFRIYQYGLLMIALGFLLDVLSKRASVRQYGMALMGLGLIFFGMELMSRATGPLGSYPPFIEAMATMRNPLLGILAGLVFTAIVQSSSATTGIVIVLAAEGLLTLEAGMALVFGANVGTCVTAALSALGRPREAVQAAVVHIIFNVGGVLAWILFIPQAAALVRVLAPEDPARQIANAHTLFNVGNALLFIWFTSPLARFVDRLVPAEEASLVTGKPLYLDEYFLDHPAMALDRVRMELTRLAGLVGNMLRESFPAVTKARQSQILQLKQADQEVNQLHGAIVLYLGRVSQASLVDPQPKQAYENMLIANYLETLGDVVDKNLMDDAQKRLQRGIAISRSTEARILDLHQAVCRAFDRVALAIETGDPAPAREAVESKAEVNRLADEATAYLAERLVAHEPNRLAAFQLEADIIENLKRLNNITRRMAKVVLSSPTAEEAPATDIDEVAPDPGS